MQLPLNSIGLQSIPCWLPVFWKRLRYSWFVDTFNHSFVLHSVTYGYVTLPPDLIWGLCSFFLDVKPCSILSFGRFPGIWILYAGVMEQCVPKRRRVSRTAGNHPKKKKAYDIQNTAKVLKSRMCILSFKIFIISDTNSKSHFTSYYSIINWQPNSPPSRDFFFFNWSPIIAHYNNRHIPSSCVAAILKVAFRKQVLYNAFFAPLTTSYVNYDLIVEMDNLPSIIPQCYYWCDRNRKVPFFFLLSP